MWCALCGSSKTLHNYAFVFQPNIKLSEQNPVKQYRNLLRLATGSDGFPSGWIAQTADSGGYLSRKIFHDFGQSEASQGDTFSNTTKFSREPSSEESTEEPMTRLFQFVSFRNPEQFSCDLESRFLCDLVKFTISNQPWWLFSHETRAVPGVGTFWELLRIATLSRKFLGHFAEVTSETFWKETFLGRKF